MLGNASAQSSAVLDFKEVGEVNMYSLVFLSCTFTVALAGYSHDHVQHMRIIDHNSIPTKIPGARRVAAQSQNGHHLYKNQEYTEHNKYYGATHIPVINSHGVPVEPHKVKAAKSQHFAAYSDASDHNNHLEYNQKSKYIRPIQFPATGSHSVQVQPPQLKVVGHQHLATYSGASADSSHNNHQEYNEHNKYYGPIRIPIIDPHSVPIEVQTAKAKHLAKHSKAVAYNTLTAHNNYNENHQNNNHHEFNEKYHGPIHIPVITPHGAPLKSNTVQPARGQHPAAHSKASTHTHLVPHNTYSVDNQEFNQHNTYYKTTHIPLVSPHGVPVETSQVKVPRPQHLSAYPSASADNTQNNHQKNNEHNKYHGPIHIPIIGPHGVPVETPEVQAAKAKHLEEHSKAVAYNALTSHYNSDKDEQYNNHHEVNENKYHGPIHNPVVTPHGAPVKPNKGEVVRTQYSSGHSKELAHTNAVSHNNHANQEYNEHNKYYGPIHIPVIGSHGVPVETNEVQSAKAKHFATHNVIGKFYKGANYTPAPINNFNSITVGHHSYGSGTYGNGSPGNTQVHNRY